MLKFKVLSLDEVEEQFRSLYTEQEDGSFQLGVDGIDDASELKGALAKERQAAKEAERRAKELERKQQELEEERLKEQNDFKSLYSRANEKAQALEDQIKQRDAQMREKTKDSIAQAISSEIAIDGSSARLLKREALEFIELEDDQEVFRIGGVTVDRRAVIEHLSTEFPRNVKGSGASGAGASGGANSGGSATVNPFKKGESFNLTEQGRLMRENPTLAAQLKKQAE
jgi:hypothetical protein